MKRILTILMAAVLLLTCGCSLAQEPPASDPILEDRLIGVLITTEYLDLFDMEAWLNDNISSVAMGKDNIIDGDTSQYQGRIYAELTEEEWTSADGTIRTRPVYKFPEELKGEALLCPTYIDERGERYTASEGSDIFSDTHVHIKGNDAGSSVELTATVYYDPLSIHQETINAIHEDGTETMEQHICFYHNPIYQTDSGEVYVTSGSGHSYGVGNSVSIYGMSGTYFMDQTFSTNLNGKVEELTNSISVTMESVRNAEKLVILEMGADNKLLRTEEYNPRSFPKELIVGADTAYVIAETHSLDENDSPVITRQVCTVNSEDERLEVFVPMGSGYVSKQETKVITE